MANVLNMADMNEEEVSCFGIPFLLLEQHVITFSTGVVTYTLPIDIFRNTILVGKVQSVSLIDGYFVLSPFDSACNYFTRLQISPCTSVILFSLFH